MVDLRQLKQLMKIKIVCVFFALILINKTPLQAQTRTNVAEVDKQALEGILIEKYEDEHVAELA